MAGMTRRDAAWALALAGAAAAAGPAAARLGPAVPGWAEVVAIVSSLSRTLAWLEQVARWRVVARGMSARATLALWGLAPGVVGREVLVGNPGDAFGRVRLVQLAGAGAEGRKRIRPAAMPWETGGLFSLMTRARDLDGAFERHMALGYDAYSSPVVFNFGGVVLKNVVLRGPDGINLAIYERVRPLLEGWDSIRGLSAPFNAMMMVADRDRSRDWWTGNAGLGLTVLQQGRFLDPAPGPNNFAIPANLTTSVGRPFAIMGEPGAETGRVEAMAFEGLQGRDFSAVAAPPRLGLVALRFRAAPPEGLVSPDGVRVERWAPVGGA